MARAWLVLPLSGESLDKCSQINPSRMPSAKQAPEITGRAPESENPLSAYAGRVLGTQFHFAPIIPSNFLRSQAKLHHAPPGLPAPYRGTPCLPCLVLPTPGLARRALPASPSTPH